MRNLATPEMIQLSAPLLTEGTRQHEAIQAVPAASAALPVLQAAHDALVHIAAGVDTAAMAERVHTLVVDHDHLVTSIGLRLDAEVAMAPSEAEATSLQHAHDLIFPPGENVLRMSAANKAGASVLRERRVTPETVAILGELPLRGGGTLADTYRALQAKAQELSVADAERQIALAEAAGPKMRDGRKRWVAAIELVDMSMTAAGADPTPALGAIRAAQARTSPSTEDTSTEGDAPATPPAPSAPPAPPALPPTAGS
jgi:hypothetical protein